MIVVNLIDYKARVTFQRQTLENGSVISKSASVSDCCHVGGGIVAYNKRQKALGSIQETVCISRNFEGYFIHTGRAKRGVHLWLEDNTLGFDLGERVYTKLGSGGYELLRNSRHSCLYYIIFT